MKKSAIKFSIFWGLPTCLIIFLPVTISFADVIAECSEAPQCWNRSITVGSAGANEIKISVTGLDADVDLFVRRGATPPSTTEFDCNPALPGTSEEICIVPLAPGETTNIGVLGAPGSSFTLESLPIENRPIDAPIPLVLGQLTPGRVIAGQPVLYQFDASTLPELSADLLIPSADNFNGLGVEFVVELKRQTNDADVLMQIGDEECSGNANGGPQDEICAVPLKSVIDPETGIGQQISIQVISGADAGTIVGYDLLLYLQKTIDVLPTAIPLIPNSTGGFEFEATTKKGLFSYYQINPELLASGPTIIVKLIPAPGQGDIDLYMQDGFPPYRFPPERFTPKEGSFVCFGDGGPTETEICELDSSTYIGTRGEEGVVEPVYVGVFGISTSRYKIQVTLQ